MKRSNWEDTKIRWGNTKYKHRRYIIGRLIKRKKVTQDGIDSEGGISYLIMKEFNDLPVFLCDALTQLRDLLMVGKARKKIN